MGLNGDGRTRKAHRWSGSYGVTRWSGSHVTAGAVSPRMAPNPPSQDPDTAWHLSAKPPAAARAAQTSSCSEPTRQPTTEACELGVAVQSLRGVLHGRARLRTSADWTHDRSNALFFASSKRCVEREFTFHFLAKQHLVCTMPRLLYLRCMPPPPPSARTESTECATQQKAVTQAGRVLKRSSTCDTRLTRRVRGDYRHTV